MNFDFINDEKFRKILTRDFEELNICYEAKASKSVLILSGSIIETILVDYFLNYLTSEIEAQKVLTMSLENLINIALDKKIISQSTRDLTTVIKNFRNLIHPGREIRKNENFDFDSALVAKSLLNIVLKEIKLKYIENIGHSANDIILKLENDSISQKIFEMILTKIHKSEKVKLYNLLVEYNCRDIYCLNQLTEPKKYLSILKSQVDREIVIHQLMKMVNKIEIGEKWEAMSYFYILYEDLIFLDESNIELILIYVLNVMSESTQNVKELESYVDKRLFSIFGVYLIKEEVKKEFLRLLCEIVTNHPKKDFIFFAAYDQLINSIDIDEKEKTKEFILKTTNSYMSEKFFVGYNDGDYFPF
jgi:hypothetical protein